MWALDIISCASICIILCDLYIIGYIIEHDIAAVPVLHSQYQQSLCKTVNLCRVLRLVGLTINIVVRCRVMEAKVFSTPKALGAVEFRAQ